MPVYWLSEENNEFPYPDTASTDGILAVGGDLSPERLLSAYQLGIFPWFNEGEPILWWSPDPRLVLFPAEMKVSKSMRPYFNQQKFRVSCDTCFRTVIEMCSLSRETEGGTWITSDMIEAYSRLHELGFAHSVEVWAGNELVGGLYGIGLGKIFFGESMFSSVSNASKFGFITLVRKLESLGYWLIDCQQETKHLSSLGARPIRRTAFLDVLKRNEGEETMRGHWRGLL